VFSRILLLTIFICPQIFSADWQVSRSKKSSGRIIFSHDQVSEGQNKVLAGIQIKLEPGWHTYWKNPGEIGLAPKAKWSLGENWTVSPIQYPAPEKTIVPTKTPLTSFGYSDQVTYLVELNGSGALSGKLEWDYLVCDSACIPEKLSFALELKAGKEKKSASFEKLTQLKSNLPRPFPKGDLQWVSATEISFKTLNTQQEVFIFTPQKTGIFWILENQEDRTLIRLNKEFSNLEVLVKSSAETYSGELANMAAPAKDVATADDTGFLLALLFAFIGGIILNLMPCVLPVVMLKAHALVVSGKKAHGTLLATSLGIVSSFVLVGVLTGLLRQAGMQVGWGFQFQIPGFLIAINLILFLFALNMFGLFEINLPHRLNQRFSSSGPFLEGVFATILATPCSAPFLGTALTYALTRGWPSLLLFFFVMGLGLATPYLLFLINPSWVKFLPKPGRWMDRMKRILAYVLLATMLWLTYVLQQQIPSAFLSVFLIGLVATFIAIKEFKSWGRVLAVLLIAAGLIYASRTPAFTNQATSTESDTAFAEKDLEDRLAKGEKIFLYITADWCLTCKFNEANVINTKEFKNLLTEANFNLMKVDWTKKDPSVASFLEKHGRVGIPFAGAFTREGVNLLPELLSLEDVKKSLSLPHP